MQDKPDPGQFAYIDLIPLESLLGKTSSLSATIQPMSHSKSHRFSITPANRHAGAPQAAVGSYYHCFLDVHAFIASPCAPGETAELYFSLFNRVENRFVTEEFCLVLNHLGSPARDPEQRLGRLRTLFTDLKFEDVASSIFLVCRMVRNGALKMRSETSGGTLDSHDTVGSIRRPSGATYMSTGTLRGTASILESLTDDSFSVTSEFGGHRAATIDTAITTNASIVDGRPSFRRPLGCAVMELSPLSKLLSDSGDKSGMGAEFSMPIFVPRDEAMFATLHEDIVHGRTKDLVTSSR